MAIFKKVLLVTALTGAFVLTETAVAQTFEPGMVVTTCYDQFNGGDPAIAIEDLRNPSTMGGILGAPWNYSGSNTAKMPASWDRNEVGQVFGLAIGKQQSATTSPDIFTSSTNIYQFGGNGSYNIFRLNPDRALTSGDYELFFSVSSNGAPNSNQESLGQIAYNHINDVLYVSNFDDGFIYTIADTGSGSGNQIGSYDHGSNRQLDISAGLAALGDDTTQSTTPDGRQVWAVQFNPIERRLYYAVHESVGLNTIWSVSVDVSGVPDATTIKKELDVNTVNTARINYISDISFSFDGSKMLIAERYKFGTNQAHSSRVLHFNGSHTSWTPIGSPNRQKIGSGGNNNSAGGVDYSYEYLADQSNIDLARPEERIVVTGDSLIVPHPTNPRVYGIQSTPISLGLNAPWNINDHYFVDFNSTIGNNDKFEIGDVEAYRIPPPTPWDCATIEASGVCTESSLGGPNTHSVTLDITHDKLGSVDNNLPITDILITTEDGVTYPDLFTPNLFNPSLPLLWGQSTSATFDVRTQPGDEEVCLVVEINKPDPSAEMTPINGFCCTETICIDIPSCESCLELQGDYLVSYSYDDNSVSIEGEVCSDNINLEDLSITTRGNDMAITSLTPTNGGTCLAFEATYTGADALPDDGLDLSFAFSASSAEDSNGVANCCKDTLSIEYLDENDPNIENLDDNIIVWPWPIDWELIEWIELGALFSTDGADRLERYLIKKNLIPQNMRVIASSEAFLIITPDNVVKDKINWVDIPVAKSTP